METTGIDNSMGDHGDKMIDGKVVITFTCGHGHNHRVELPFNAVIVGVLGTDNAKEGKKDFKVMMGGTSPELVAIGAGINDTVKGKVLGAMLSEIADMMGSDIPDHVKKQLAKAQAEVQKANINMEHVDIIHNDTPLNIGKKEDPISDIINALKKRRPEDS